MLGIKYITVMILTSALCTFSSYAKQALNDVVISDNALQTCLNQHSEKYQWRWVEDVMKLKCHGKNIKNIDGLTHFYNLSSLSLFNNKLKNIDVSAFTQLTHLNVANNQLSSITLTHLAKLESLYLFKNKLSTIDLTGLTQLKKMRITNNKLSTLDISPLTSLEKAYLFDNELEDLIVKGLPKLTFIELRQNPMPDEVYERYDALEGITIIHDGNADDWK